jgi:prepilin-type N-terminal cleavage/methylation domain-containing protein
MVRKNGGFTLTELMLVVAIIGIIAAITAPKFADMVIKSKEAVVKGSLGALRSAITIYYADTEGVFPRKMQLSTALSTGSKYLDRLPYAEVPRPGSHGNNNAEALSMDDFAGGSRAGVWYYLSSEGHVVVNCTHTDTKGSTWSVW